MQEGNVEEIVYNLMKPYYLIGLAFFIIIVAHAQQGNYFMDLDPSILKPAPESGVPTGLYHVIVEVVAEDSEVLFLAPMTSRAMPLSVLGKSDVHASLEELVATINKLPDNITVYATRADAFQKGNRHIRVLTVLEVKQIRKLLGVE
ncbi:MAG: hypothetical protein L3J20_08820 [Flavobacteriaceae bacterium]|nr:hypothetical protein [Flavobacteriaceae bacterium]